jgi:hypothetical protein
MSPLVTWRISVENFVVGWKKTKIVFGIAAETSGTCLNLLRMNLPCSDEGSYHYYSVPVKFV